MYSLSCDVKVLEEQLTSDLSFTSHVRHLLDPQKASQRISGFFSVNKSVLLVLSLDNT